MLGRLIFMTLGNDLPSIIRFYTFLPHLCKQALGCIVNTVLPRVAKASFVGTDDGDVDGYHSNWNQKKETSLEHLGTCPGNSMILTAAYVVPMQSLSLKLQVADFVAGGMKFLIDRRSTGCIASTYGALWDTWAYWQSDGGSKVLQAVLWHGMEQGLVKSEMLDWSRQLALSFGAGVFVLESQYHHGVFRWLSSDVLDESDQQLEDVAFFNCLPCDLDELFGKPLRLLLRSPQDLQKPEHRALRAELNHRLKATNMKLESELAAVRAALPRGKACPGAEMQCYLPHVSMILQQHVATGRPNPNAPEKQADLIRENVPLEQRPARRWFRPDRTALNAKNTRRCDGSIESPETCVVEDALPQADEQHYDYDALWDIGDDQLPMRESVLRRFLAEASNRSTVGCANKAAEIRKTNAASLIVKDNNAVPAEKKFCIRLSCRELHPGLCCSRDSEVYRDALQLAKSLERCIGEHLLYKFILLKEGTPGDRRGKFFYVCRRRRRRPYSQMTHVLAKVRRTNTGSYVFQEMQAKRWFFWTLWSVAKTLLEARWARILVCELSWLNNDDGSVVVNNSALNQWEVWPSTFKSPKKEAVDDGPRLDDGPRPRAAKKRSGGVHIIPPTGGGFVINDSGSSQSSDEGEVEIPAAFEMPVVVEAPSTGGGHEPSVGAAPLRAGPGTHSFKWKGFTISRVRKNAIRVGWGLTCNKHHDYDGSGLIVSRTPCKIQLPYGVGANALSDDECIVRLKRWAKASSV